ncbi:MAG: type II secretion system F family protein [Candidatus Aureabacteria bacterium]|nr:type II secretion system F family protein [Candidatus Auribacterota bacterium]
MKKKYLEKIFKDFINELSMLLDNGFDILTSLELIKKTSSKKDTKEIFNKIIDSIKSGETFTQSLFNSDFFFLPVFYKTVFFSAEKSGTFQKAVKELCSFIKKKDSFENNIKKILIYPVITISVATAALFVVFFHFIPSLAVIYKDMDIEIPITSKWIIMLTENTSFLILLPIILITVFLLFRSFVPINKQNIIKKIKPLSGFVIWFDCYTLSFYLHMLLESGIDIIESLKVISISDISGSNIKEIITDIKNGADMIDAFKKRSDLPEIFFENLSLGLRSGNIKRSFKYLYESAQERLEKNITFITAFLEPIVIIITAGIVGIIVFLGLYPLLTISETIQTF